MLLKKKALFSRDWERAIKKINQEELGGKSKSVREVLVKPENAT